MIDKRNYMVVGNHSTKKRKQASSKDRSNNISVNSGGANMIDFSNRHSNKNIFHNVNPYLFEITSGKKSIKKKSESIDFVSLTFIID